MTNIFVGIASFIFVYMSFWFILSLVFKRNDVADLAWGMGFVSIATILTFLHPGNRHLFLIFLLVSIWGVRLSSHIFRRISQNPEDKRYLEWRESWGKLFYVRSYLQVFLLQGIFMFLISLSIMFSSTEAKKIGVISILGLLIWISGFLFESISDNQLFEFAKTKKPGQIMQTGLWHYSRHPNYFGEVTQWWGIALISFESSQTFMTFISPLTITWLILFVSGIPLLENKYKDNPEFIKYKSKTSVFIPWFPKK